MAKDNYQYRYSTVVASFTVTIASVRRSFVSQFGYAQTDKRALALILHPHRRSTDKDNVCKVSRCCNVTPNSAHLHSSPRTLSRNQEAIPRVILCYGPCVHVGSTLARVEVNTVDVRGDCYAPSLCQTSYSHASSRRVERSSCIRVRLPLLALELLLAFTFAGGYLLQGLASSCDNRCQRAGSRQRVDMMGEQ